MTDELPSDDEIPDDVPSVDDIDPFTVDDDDFDTVDEFAAAEWNAQTTAESHALPQLLWLNRFFALITFRKEPRLTFDFVFDEDSSC